MQDEQVLSKQPRKVWTLGLRVSWDPIQHCQERTVVLVLLEDHIPWFTLQTIVTQVQLTLFVNGGG